MHIKNLIRKLKPASKTEKDLTESLRIKIGRLNEGRIPPTSLASWQTNVATLRKNILNQDPRFFLEWNITRHTMVHECKPVELEYLRALKNWPKLREAIIESPAGNPRPYSAYRQSSGNLIHQAYSLAQLESHFPFNIEKTKVICEFGGGYGSMARLMLRLGFKGQYIIFDLPEFLCLQEYYLKSASTDAQIHTTPTNTASVSVILLSELSALTEQLKMSGQPDIFIALWSLSESPLDLRDEILKRAKRAKNFLVAYQDIFDNIDNAAYFSALVKKNKSVIFHTRPINHLKGKHCYLLGQNQG